MLLSFRETFTMLFSRSTFLRVSLRSQKLKTLDKDKGGESFLEAKFLAYVRRCGRKI